MPRPKLTEEDIAAMRRRVLDASESILQTEGAGGLSIRSIAERVGVSPMALYSYFENRDELFHALREHHRQMLHARHADALERARDGDAAAVTAEVLAGYVSFFRRNPQIFQFLWCSQPDATLPPNEPDDCPQGKGVQELLEHLAQLITLGIECGDFAERDAMLAARMTFGIIHGPLMLSLIPGAMDAWTLERLETEIVTAAMSYLSLQETA